jgi:hypothetical protein
MNRRIQRALLLGLPLIGLLCSAGANAASIPVKQGGVVRIPIPMEADSVTGTWMGKPIPFFKGAGGWEALIGIDLDQLPGRLPFSASWGKGGEGGTFSHVIEIQPGAFGTQTLTLPKEKAEPDADALSRIAPEKKRFEAAFQESHPQRYWTEGFIVPVAGPALGSFGKRRVINGQPRAPHTGEDIAAPLGTAVLAANNGVVVLTGDFYFNGRSVLIDHGLGLFSMYFHLAEIAVQPGAQIARGSRIGQVGQSGRATGPHLHWGVRLNNARVDPFSLVEETGRKR